MFCFENPYFLLQSAKHYDIKEGNTEHSILAVQPKSI